MTISNEEVGFLRDSLERKSKGILQDYKSLLHIIGWLMIGGYDCRSFLRGGHFKADAAYFVPCGTF